MLPDTSLIMGFRYRGMTSYLTHAVDNALPFAVVAGLRKSIQLMRDGNDTANLLVVFHPAGAAAFLREPLHELFGEVLSLKEMKGYKQLNAVEDRLCEARTDRKRIQVIEQFLLSRLHQEAGDPLVAAAVEMIKGYHGKIRIEDLSRRLFISIDAFEKRFRRATGASPRRFANIVRMHTAINNLQNHPIVKVALEAGYYDQSHFAKDFKLFTGKTPAEFLKSPVV